MDAIVMQRAKEWLGDGFDPQTRAAVQDLIDNNPKELEESFYRMLEFGTGGLRGIMGPGTNRMNVYTVALATQGLASYVKEVFPDIPHPRAVISYDCRNQSAAFARRVAEVLAANEFDVFLFDALRPTPELSFAIRHLNCQTGIMITASHNPREYNGYKAYWSDGGQVLPPHDKGIIRAVNATAWSDIKLYKEGITGSITYIGKEVDEAYLSAILSLIGYSPEAIGTHGDMKIVYTPLHGTGVNMVPQALSRMGFTHIIHVPQQDVNDGNFPTVKSPNPEEPSALQMAIEKAEATGADLVLATDPDADRVGIAVRNDKGEMQLLNGNQTAGILTYYLLRRRAETGRLKASDYMIKTIVTTDLIEAICRSYGVECFQVLTGFKYIAQVVEQLHGQREFIGGGEESYGYNVGEFVRDKDAVVACSLIAETAAWAASQGLTLYRLLMKIYATYGYYKESMVSLTLKGKEGAQRISQMMRDFRHEPPHTIADSKVVIIKDYLARKTLNLEEGGEWPIDLPQSDVLQFYCKDGTLVTVRPSGTEPKIKFYIGLFCNLEDTLDFEAAEAAVESRMARVKQDFIPKS